MEKSAKKSIFDTPLLSTKVKSAKAKIFPEGVLGYFIGPTLALLANSILSNYFNMYMTNILNITSWASTFFTLLPGLSVIMVVIGNILVGRLMDHNKSRAGKARPLILLSIPLSVLALIVLFIISPFANETAASGTQIGAMVCIAIGYNLWFSIAYPCYYTSHAALVNLSTRSSKDRSLLATISNATALAAMGLCTMILPFFLSLLFVYQTDAAVLATQYPDAIKAVDEAGKELGYWTLNGQPIYDQTASYNAWKIFVIALMVITAVGAIIEYYFTRERITEESFASSGNSSKKATPLKDQAKVCLKDKFWWIMIVFFLLYQLGGMVKNVSQLYYCQAMFADAAGNYTTATGGSFSGTLAILGAIPTALGMVIAWPLSNKIGKGKAIMFGAILSVIGGAIGFIAPQNFYVVAASFAIKALGSTPAMYLSLALLADMLDHQEAKHKFRTDGLTMTVYGAIMAGMTGIATTILNGVLSATGYNGDNIAPKALQTAMPWIFIGVETFCYLGIFIMFIFMNVEKYSKEDHETILENQKQAALAAGEEWIEPEERMRREEEAADAAVEEARKAELKARCEKKGLNYEEEEAKYQAVQEEKRRAAEKKKAEKEAKKAAKNGATVTPPTEGTAEEQPQAEEAGEEKVEEAAADEETQE